MLLDGRLDDAVWKQATFHSDFEQKGNDRSYPARVRTEVAFLRDDEALYVAARMQNDIRGRAARTARAPGTMWGKRRAVPGLARHTP